MKLKLTKNLICFYNYKDRYIYKIYTEHLTNENILFQVFNYLANAQDCSSAKNLKYRSLLPL